MDPRQSLQELKEAGGSPEELQDLLYKVVRERDTEDAGEVVEWLVSKGVDVNKEDSEGQRALFHAIEPGLANKEHPPHLPAVKALLSAGADPSLVVNEETKANAIHQACDGDRGHHDYISAVLEKVDNNSSALEEKDSEGRTPLAVVCLMAGVGYMVTADQAAKNATMLLEKGTPASSAMDTEGRPLLLQVAFRGDLMPLIPVLSKVTDVNGQFDDEFGEKCTALSKAVQAENKDTVEALLEVGADPKVKCTMASFSVTPEELAKSMDYNDIAAVLAAAPQELQPQGGKGCVTILSVTGKKMEIEIDASITTIKEAKEKYQDTQGVPPEQQVFVYPIPEELEAAITNEDYDKINKLAVLAKKDHALGDNVSIEPYFGKTILMILQLVVVSDSDDDDDDDDNSTPLSSEEDKRRCLIM